MLRIENQAIIFALLSKYTFLGLGESGRERAHEVIQKGMIRYGRERGMRMAARARNNGDPVKLWTNQAYGEWKPDYDGQMERSEKGRPVRLTSVNAHGVRPGKNMTFWNMEENTV